MKPSSPLTILAGNHDFEHIGMTGCIFGLAIGMSVEGAFVVKRSPPLSVAQLVDKVCADASQ